MSTKESTDKPGGAALLRYLERTTELHRDALLESSLAPEIAHLRRWQSERLAWTHADMMNNPRYRGAMEFFREELYGPKDFSQRDADIARVYPLMVQVLPDQALEALSRALELNVLSHELDARLVQELKALDANEHITETAYCEAYRRCDNYSARRHQIELINQLAHELDRVVHQRFIGSALKLARRPAKLAGFGALQTFLERGYAAFRRIKGADQFIETIVNRELELLDRIYAGETRPFGFEPAADKADNKPSN
ncbi:MAG TPA: hypothetical protein VFY81_12255 [Gammaproteobacteria bacterium]|nr:hypothetical protein [Gammaproteobacteria bacterium]